MALSEVDGAEGKMERKEDNGDKATKRSRGIPKEETGVYDLFRKYPGADGTGVKIAVMDTGCCLRAKGLSGTTSDGVTPKYIDFIDCTGDGDIPMDKTVDFDYEKSPTVEGVSGRTLELGEWAKDANELKLGAVRLYELLPRAVERRVKRERKEAFLAKHQAAISATQSKLDSLTTDGKEGDEKAAAEKERKELKLLLEQLGAVAEAHEDSGPLMDVVMFEEEGAWKAAIDLEASGDLTEAAPMSPFAVARDVGELGFGAHVSFCIQVYDGGDTLSVVTDAGSHGTHVAGIAASCAPDEGGGDPNGVAPGAQILALKIGDGRLGSTETGTGLIRALIAAKRHGCDVANLSYGEPSWQMDRGRVSEVFAKAVFDWGMAVFTSAGNDGPALSSLGSPGSLAAPVTVGAYVSPEMMAEQYSTLPPMDGDPPLAGASYYFSSRGPTPDGLLPDVCGPGGAISSVPRHALQGRAQYHGTSMSSPNVCGVAACVLSAVGRKGIEGCGPVELKRALRNTAVAGDVAEPFSQGAGLVSALDCAEYIVENHGKRGQNVAIDVSVPSRNGARGIYIRDEMELDGPMSFGVKVTPRFSHANRRTPSEMDELLSLEQNLMLKSSEAWATCPESLTLTSAKERGGQTFSVRLNTKDLAPGVHYATVDAFDVADEKRGSLFSLPITVIVPHSRSVSAANPTFSLNDAEDIRLKDNGLDYSTTFELRQGVPNRRFLAVPGGAEWATIKLKGGDPAAAGTAPRMVLHAVPFVRGDLPNTECQLKRIYQVREGVEDEFHVRVRGGSSLEVCLQLLWLANPAPATVSAEIEFHSLNARSPTLASSQPATITAAAEFARLGAGAPLRAEQLNPSCSLKSALRTLRPTDFDIRLGSAERDAEPPSDAELAANPDGPPSRIYELRLKYQFSIEGDKAIEARPSFPSLFSQLYDSPMDSQLWSLRDGNSKIITYGSCMHHADAEPLKKGNYTIDLLLRHPNRTVLDQMKGLPCEVSLTLPDALACKVYDELDKASTPTLKDDGRSPLGKKLLLKGSHQDIYVSRPADDPPAWVAPGDVLSGSLVLDKGRESVTSMKLLYVVPPKSKAKDDKGEKPAPDKEKKDSLEDIVFKAKLGHLAGLRAEKSADYEEAAAKLREERPSSVPLLSELLLDALEGPVPENAPFAKASEDESRAGAVQMLYTTMQKADGGPIDFSSLAQYFGMNEPDKDDLDEDEEAKALDKEMKEQRDLLRKVLLARAVLVSSITEEKQTSAVDPVDRLDVAVKELKKWVTVGDLKDDEEKVRMSIALARHARICQGRKASAMSILLKARKDFASGKNAKELDMELLKVYGLFEGMGHLKENLEEGIQRRFPVLKRSV